VHSADAVKAAASLQLLPPSLKRLPQYEAALAAGWSPDTERDASAEQLARLRQGRRTFLASLTRQGGTMITAWGEEVERLPSRLFWLDDGEFCGIADFRYVPGLDTLPDYVPGHIGYAVVPWKRRRGYASRALALVLDVAREQGMRSIEITCDHDNEASRRVIQRNGGLFTGNRSREGEKLKLVFRIALTVA
jgi:predicted acetyltransferase